MVRTDDSNDLPSAGDRAPKRGTGAPACSRSRWLHTLAVLWTFVLAGLLLAPALARGWMLGTYDLLAGVGFTSRTGVVVHGSYANWDMIDQMVQWTSLNWTQVHHGVLPLWNPYNGLGLPLAFNWQSASFSVPSLIGYLFPARLAYTVSIVATLVIAGTGAYVFARVLRVGFAGAVLAASVFELGGPLIAWLGYPHGQVLAWCGWLFAAATLVLLGKRRIPAIAFLAVVIACAIYAGQPEVLILMVGALAVFLAMMFVFRAVSPRMGLTGGPIRRPFLDLCVSMAAGLGLGAALLLPGLQLTSASVRGISTGNSTLSVHDLTYFIFSSFDGVPVPGNFGFGASFEYIGFAAYVGVIALVLGAVAVAVGYRHRRPEAIAVFAVVVVLVAVCFVPPLDTGLSKLPLLGQVQTLRALMPLSLAFAVLAGIGLDDVVRDPSLRTVRRSLLWGFVVAGLVLAGVWLLGRGGTLPAAPRIRAVAIHVRAESFVWPAVGVAVGLAASALLWWKSHLRIVAASGLLVCETLFLLAAGSIQIASSSNGYPAPPTVVALQHAIGGATVGAGPSVGCSPGIAQDVNISYGVHEANAYDPILPKAYFSAWQRFAATPGGYPVFNVFDPCIETAGQARLLGVAYVLELHAKSGPLGGVFVRELQPANAPAEDLYRIPGAGSATVTPIEPEGTLPPADAPGTPVAVDDSNPSRWSLTTHTSTPSVLRLRLTEVPGWHATIDGRPLQLENLDGLMFQARIPPGRHVVELHYWPTAFTVGLVLAVATALALAAALGLDLFRRRTGRDSEMAPPEYQKRE